ncbi:Sorting nexin-15 [Liparis tanakae]|uniref:Sorting nexin-15 n=1 Tax=Liparis tanakae TaxID=230148 RepID=A0A4Z2GIF0_9TELE|nr:Sorting nexin-15 [Liparis tanakae]
MSRKPKDEYYRFFAVTDPRTHEKGYTEYKVTARGAEPKGSADRDQRGVRRGADRHSSTTSGPFTAVESREGKRNGSSMYFTGVTQQLSVNRCGRPQTPPDEFKLWLLTNNFPSVTDDFTVRVLRIIRQKNQ